ncbi:MAG TPA: response regulator transcription factor [Saprospiraceae bacterium]|nr:response regulator transcription factor [Saprospiraceae bacterium]HMQ82697.1 response regulator transcription factor [Saprospiraceae bacterium]
MKILVVEDEKELAENIRAYLSRSDMICEAAFDFAEAQDKLLSFEYDIVLLDIMLPDGNGLHLLRLLKQLQPETGVLIVSAKNALDDKVKGLELGADDYLTKPFHLPELNARLNAIFRRRKFQGHKMLEFGDLHVNTDTHDVLVKGQPLVLTVKEYELLLFFISNKNRPLTKQIIAEHLWGDHVDFLDSFDFVYQHIKNLRKKITAAGGADYIKTIYGLGYKFSED